VRVLDFVLDFAKKTQNRRRGGSGWAIDQLDQELCVSLSFAEEAVLVGLLIN
jgi:hypothetical protein